MSQESVSGSAKQPPRQFSVEEKLEIIKFADQSGLRPATSKFAVSCSTISKWRKAYRQHGSDALVARSSRPHHQPKKTHQWIIDKINSLKTERPEMGSSAMSAHLDRNEAVKLSANTVKKIYKSEGLLDGDQGAAQSAYMVKGDAGKQVEQQLEAASLYTLAIPQTHPT